MTTEIAESAERLHRQTTSNFEDAVRVNITSVLGRIMYSAVNRRTFVRTQEIGQFGHSLSAQETGGRFENLYVPEK